jgi:U3 small nucleolar RNA-associated protein 12
MQHTYLRYECADAFSLTTSASTTSTLTTSPLTFLNHGNTKSSSSSSSILLSTAGSQIIGYNLRTNEPCLKIGHRELLSGGLGTGKALNSNEVLCVATTTTNSAATATTATANHTEYKVATGWKDGSIRIFDVYNDDIQNKSMSNESKLGLVHSLLFDNIHSASAKNEDFIMREPLVLNGHSNSSVTCLSFGSTATTTTNNNMTKNNYHLLASGSSDGKIILWDIIAETGLFRFIGHKGPITDLSFSNLYASYNKETSTSTFNGDNGVGGSSSSISSGNDGATTSDMVLISSSLDGLVKVWNMDSQCCVQTIANHNGQVTCSSALSMISESNSNSNSSNNDATTNTNESTNSNMTCRSRFITGCIDGKVRVWSIHSSRRMIMERTKNMNDENNTSEPMELVGSGTTDQDDICTYMGTLPSPPNSISNEKIQLVQNYATSTTDQTTYVGVLRTNTKYVDLYLVRDLNETMKKKTRRLRRKREKDSKKQQEDVSGKRGKKRGLLDEDNEDMKDDGHQMKDNTELLNDTLFDSDDNIKASDEFEYITTVRSSQKIKAFTFAPSKQKKGGLFRVVLSLATNAFEVHSINKSSDQDDVDKPNTTQYQTNLLSTLDMYGHPTGIRSIALSGDDTYACTVSKSMAKVWNINNRSCVRSLPLNSSVFKTQSKKASFYGLCVTFLPGDTHFVVGTREGHLLIIDIASGDIVFFEENAHDKEIWSIDLKKPKPENSYQVDDADKNSGSITIMTGSADKSVKFWEIETQTKDDGSGDDSDGSDEENPFLNHPMLFHVRTLQTTDDVVACRYSYDFSKRLIFVSTLDSQIKVFFDDTLKFFLSLYGHSLPALALDASDDDVLLASGGADKTIKIWGLDFGDTHRTLYGHSDSITDLKFVKKTHYFFTCSKDNTVRYWDADRFEQILLLNGHNSEINCLAVAKTGAFVLTGGMDRQVRVWERTKDMVFLEEEKDRELEETFDKVDGRDEKGTEEILRRGGADEDDNEDDNDENNPQSEAAVRRSVLSIASGDRIMEALERADEELKEIAMFNQFQKTKNEKDRKERTPNMLMMGMDPHTYILWVLRTIKNAELEQSLLILPLSHMERLLYYLIILLRKGQAVEICSRAAVFLIKSHQNQVVYGGSGTSKQSKSMSVPLRELRRLLKLRLGETRDTIGYNMAAMKMVIRASNERKSQYRIPDANEDKPVDIWKDLGRL